jgi:hypothetical protein
MRIVIATVRKRRFLGTRAIPPAVERRIAQALENPPWGSSATITRDCWTSTSDAVRIDMVSNEPEGRPPIVRYPTGRAAIWTGYTDEDAFVDGPPSLGMAAELPGCFALVTAAEHEAIGVTSVHRIEPLYYAEGEQVLVLSNSARMAYQVAQVPGSEIPLAALIGISGPGFMLNDETPFPGVTAVPAGAYVSLGPHGSMVRSLPAPDVDPDSPLETVVGRLTDALISAAEVIGRTPWKRTVQLTGGKDSRLAAVVLAAAGVEFAASSTGVLTHPDVILGRRVAQLLGAAHEVRPPVGAVRDADVVEVRPLKRAYSALRGCEGMLSAYETINLNGSYRSGAMNLGGHGGELLRGGYAFGVPSAPTSQLLRRLGGTIEPHRRLLSQQACAELDRIAEPWRSLMSSDPHLASERLYRVLRTGRWHAVAHSVYSIAGPRRSLLADNRVVRLVSAARQNLAAEERLTHAVLHRLRPDVCAVPLYPKRWNFEKKQPATDCDAESWAERTPPAATEQQAWNWKASYPVELHKYFTEVILAAPLYNDLLARPQVESFLEETAEERSRPHANWVWNLYTASQLIAGLGSQPAEPDGPVFRIPIPKA